MRLVTNRFGDIPFQGSQVLVFEQGIETYPRERQWLLVADACHEHLYWLQCISNSNIAIPILSVEALQVDYQLVTAKGTLDPSPDKLLVLLPINESPSELSMDLHMPIVIDAKSGIGLQLRNERYQQVQRITSESPTTLRQTA